MIYIIFFFNTNSFDHNAAVIMRAYLDKDIEAIEKVQQFGLRTCLKQWDLNQEELLQVANVASLASRRSQAKLTHLYKIVNELADYPNAPLLPKMHHYNSRRTNSRKFVQHRARTTQFQRPFFPDTIKKWNLLPAEALAVQLIFTKFQEIHLVILIFVIALSLATY